MQKGKLETDIIMQKAAKESNAETAIAEDDDREYYRQEVGEEPDKGKEIIITFINIIASHFLAFQPYWRTKEKLFLFYLKQYFFCICIFLFKSFCME